MVLHTAGNEIGVLIGVAIWTSIANVAIRWFYLPGSFPYNLVFSFAAVSTANPDIVTRNAEFNWLNHIVRILTDICFICVGLMAYQGMFHAYGIDSNTVQDVSGVMMRMANRGVLCKVVASVLYYIGNFTLFGGYRLGWNAVCVPFLHIFSNIMLFFWPPPP